MLVIAAVAVMVRLGLWQLNRLEQRRANNVQILGQASAPSLDLNGVSAPDSLLPLTYRLATARGAYDFENEVILRNQVWNNEHGVHIVTPLQLADSELTVMVDRGWIPITDYSPGEWPRLGETGLIEVQGILRQTQLPNTFGFRPETTVAEDENRLAWTYLNLALLGDQVQGPLLPMYLQLVPGDESPTIPAAWPRSALPFPNPPELVLDEGPHLSYAIQWFLFASILAVGYPFYLQRQTKERAVA